MYKTIPSCYAGVLTAVAAPPLGDGMTAGADCTGAPAPAADGDGAGLNGGCWASVVDDVLEPAAVAPLRFCPLDNIFSVTRSTSCSKYWCQNAGSFSRAGTNRKRSLANRSSSFNSRSCSQMGSVCLIGSSGGCNDHDTHKVMMCHALLTLSCLSLSPTLTSIPLAVAARKSQCFSTSSADMPCTICWISSLSHSSTMPLGRNADACSTMANHRSSRARSRSTSGLTLAAATGASPVLAFCAPIKDALCGVS